MEIDYNICYEIGISNNYNGDCFDKIVKYFQKFLI